MMPPIGSTVLIDGRKDFGAVEVVGYQEYGFEKKVWFIEVRTPSMGIVGFNVDRCHITRMPEKKGHDTN